MWYAGVVVLSVAAVAEPPDGGFKMKTELLPGNDVAYGEPVCVSITLSNETRRPLGYVSSIFGCGFPDVNIMVLQEEWENADLWSPARGRSTQDPTLAHWLMPGEALVMTLNVSAWRGGFVAELPLPPEKPGEYYVWAAFSSGGCWGFRCQTLRSGPLMLKVREEGKGGTRWPEGEIWAEKYSIFKSGWRDPLRWLRELERELQRGAEGRPEARRKAKQQTASGARWAYFVSGIACGCAIGVAVFLLLLRRKRRAS